MNILYINHYAGSPQHGMEFRPYYLAREWVQCGCKVQIIAADYSHLRQHNPQLTRGYQEEWIDGIQYIWCKTPRYSGNGYKRVVNIFCFLLRVWRWVYAQQWKPDIVIASSTYPLDIWLAAWIAKQRGARLIYEVHDLWPLTLVEVGGMRPQHPFIRLLQCSEDFAYRTADIVISMLPYAKNYMMAHGMSVDKYHVIPNGVTAADWQATSTVLPDEHVRQLDQAKGFLVGYAGGHGLANALNNLLEAAAVLVQVPVTFVLVGDGPVKATLQQQARNLNLNNILFLPSVPKRAIPTLLARMDVLFIGWRNLPIYRFGINPNKLFDYMMAARPIIHSVSADNDIVEVAGAGISVAAENPIAIARAVQQMMALTIEQRQAIGEAGQRYVIQHHDYSMLAWRFLQAVTGNNPAIRA